MITVTVHQLNEGSYSHLAIEVQTVLFWHGRWKFVTG